MEKLYKAVRPDGTDFYTGTVRWLPKAGPLKRKRTVKHPTSTKAVLGDHSTSLAVSDDPTDLPGASWPMRLAVVEPVGEALTPSEHKRQAVAWRVVEEVDPSIRFGPNGVHVVSLIDRVSRLTVDEARGLRAAGYAARYAAGHAARYAAGDAARDAARYAAGYAAWDAAWALAVRDLIGSYGFTQAHYDTLTGPWRKAVGRIHPDDAEL